MTKNYSARWYAAVQELDNGHIERGLLSLSELYKVKNELDIDLRADVAYSYCVALSKLGNFEEALKVIEEYRDAVGYGSSRFNAIDVAIEISSIYTSMDHFDLGCLEAQKAIELLAELGLTDHIAFMNKGRAEIGLKLYDDAERDLKIALSITCERHKMRAIGIICEYLGRVALERNFLNEAMAWAKKSSEISLRRAPEFLEEINKLIEQIEESANGEPIKEVQPVEFVLLEQLNDIFDKNEYDCRLDLLDIDLYSFVNGISRNRDHYFIDIKIPNEIEKQAVLLSSEISSICEHYYYPKIVEDSFLFKHLGLNSCQIPSTATLKTSIVSAKKFHSNALVHWTCLDPWPWGFRAVLKSLSDLHTYAFFNIKNTQEKFQRQGNESPEFIALTGRTWPRAIQSKYIGLGEFETGAIRVPPHTVEDITRQGINDKKYNVHKFIEMNYSPDEAKELSEGGLIGIPFSQVRGLFQGLSEPLITFGTLPIDEINLMNIPKYGLKVKADLERPGFLIDKYYNTSFLARKPNDYAFYGQKNDQFRDHYDTFRQKVNIVGTIRAKHYAIPIIEAGSLEDLEKITSYVPKFPELKTGIYFRGQTKPYYLNRSKIVNNFLFGIDDILVPSLLGSDQRFGMNYNKVHSMLQILIQDFIYQEANSSGIDLDSLHEEWFKIASSPTGEWDTSVMALAQHYGLPTFGLDITSNLKVATWFATNKFYQHSDGTAEYRKMKESDWPQNPMFWPTIYIIQPVTNSIIPSIRNINLLTNLGVKALRPERQYAHFFMGSQGIHQNRLAEALVCQLRLKPGIYETGQTFKHLFPSPYEDPSYKFMLSLREKYSEGPYGKFFEKIVSFNNN